MRFSRADGSLMVGERPRPVPTCSSLILSHREFTVEGFLKALLYLHYMTLTFLLRSHFMLHDLALHGASRESEKPSAR